MAGEIGGSSEEMKFGKGCPDLAGVRGDEELGCGSVVEKERKEEWDGD